MKSKWVSMALAGLIAAPALATDWDVVEASVSDVYVFNTSNPVAGVAVVTRELFAVTANISTTELLPGGAYSLWWVVFNKPQYCSGPCGLDDLPPNGGDPRIEASLLWGAAFVADAAGSANVNARLYRNDPPGEVRFGPGLKRVGSAEIHVVLRTHGAAIPGMVAEQTGSFGGGCGPGPTFSGCANVQSSVHFAAL